MYSVWDAQSFRDNPVDIDLNQQDCRLWCRRPSSGLAALFLLRLPLVVSTFRLRRVYAPLLGEFTVGPEPAR